MPPLPEFELAPTPEPEPPAPPTETDPLTGEEVATFAKEAVAALRLCNADKASFLEELHKEVARIKAQTVPTGNPTRDTVTTTDREN